MKNYLTYLKVVIIIALIFTFSNCSNETVEPKEKLEGMFASVDDENLDIIGVSANKELMGVKLNENTNFPEYAVIGIDGKIESVLYFTEEGLPDHIYSHNSYIFFRNFRPDKVDFGILANGEQEIIRDVDCDAAYFFEEGFPNKANKKGGADIQSKSSIALKVVGHGINVALCAFYIKGSIATWGALAPWAKVHCGLTLTGIAMDVLPAYTENPNDDAFSNLLTTATASANPSSLLAAMSVILDEYDDNVLSNAILLALLDAELQGANHYLGEIHPSTLSVFGGHQLTIYGYGFGESQGNSYVKFSHSVTHSVSYWSDEYIIVDIEQGYIDNPGEVTVFINGVRTNGRKYKIGYPQILWTTPENVKPGDELTLEVEYFPPEQTGFISFKGKNETRINVSDFLAWDSVAGMVNSVKLKIPEDALAGDIWYEAFGVKGKPFYLKLAGPIIHSVSPNKADIGTSIIIKGENFGEKQENGYVNFKNKTATICESWNNTEIKVKVPEGTKTGDLYVVAKDQPSNSFWFVIPPIIESVSPDSVETYDMVNISGRNFGEYNQDCFVLFNGVKASGYSIWTDTEIIAQVPIGAKSGYVAVEVNTERSNGKFLYIKETGNFSLTGNWRISGNVHVDYSETLEQLGYKDSYTDYPEYPDEIILSSNYGVIAIKLYNFILGKVGNYSPVTISGVGGSIYSFQMPSDNDGHSTLVEITLENINSIKISAIIQADPNSNDLFVRYSFSGYRVK